MRFFRKIIQKTGFDIHRYQKQADFWQYLNSLNIKTILDIGANVGQFAKEAREKIPEVMIYSFEPLKEIYQKLNKEFKTDKRFQSFNFALGDKTEKIIMNKSSYSPSSSILSMSDNHKRLFPHTKEHTEEIIYVKRLDDMSINIKLDREILIKIDVQGFENKVIDGGVNTFKISKVILIENSFIELYKDQATFDKTYQKLKSLDFVYNGSLQQKVNKETGEIISQDSIFLKQEL